MKSFELTIAEATRKAQEHARVHGISPGSRVSHPDEEWSWELDRVEGDTAYLRIRPEHSSTGKEMTKQYPAAEIFNVNLVTRLAMEAVCDDTVRKVLERLSKK